MILSITMFNYIIKHMKKISIIISILLIIGALSFYFRGDINESILELKKQSLPNEIKISSSTPLTDTSKSKSINLAVPFSSQAPYGDWGLPYLEACEETSAILVNAFYRNKKLTPEIVNDEILKVINWEDKNFGYYKHTTASETARILIEYFNYKEVKVEYDISINDIKEHLLAGRPVIVPLAGRELKNPYYTAPGPIYHMLVIKGITKGGDFITHDVGTKRGNNYVYKEKLLYDAIHDAPLAGGELSNLELEKEIPIGRKAIIVVYQN